MNKLQFSVLASGSRGNAVAVFPGDGPGFLLDCGLRVSELMSRLRLIDRPTPPEVFYTHLHTDHANGSCMNAFGSIVSYHASGISYISGGASITPFPLDHGNCVCHGFRVDYKGLSMAYLVDTCRVPEQSMRHLFDLDAIIIEASYRQALLSEVGNAFYGDVGERHLSNEQTSCVLGLVNSKKLKYVIMAHLSPRLNTPEFALNAGMAGAPQAEIITAGQDAPTRMITLMG